MNYFHFKNIEKVLNYIKIVYNKYSNINYVGYGKKYFQIYYYIGNIQYNLPSGKGIMYNNNGCILFEGSWIKGYLEGQGKHCLKSGHY